MKKIILLLICAVAFLITSWILIRSTGVFNTYKVASSANEPNLHIGQTIMTSNLKRANLFDFITIKLQGQLVIYRICGMPGNKVELKNGMLIINDNIIENSFETNHPYQILKKELNALNDFGINTDDYFQENDTTFNVNLRIMLLRNTI